MDRGERQIVYVGLSGGVDSAVSAALLKKQGFRVRGIFMKCWSPESAFASLEATADKSAGEEWYTGELARRSLGEGGCQWERDQKDAKAVADYLGIPFETWNFEKEYKERVVDYMIGEYARGRTPNPDVMCNQEIKFGLFFERAIQEGGDFVATGHYAQVREGKSKPSSPEPLFESEPRGRGQVEGNAKGKTYYLRAGKDKNKDQSYFLYRIGQEHLARILFPIGGYKKEEVRNMAKRLGLPNATRRDSQGICFVGELDIREFLKMYIPEKEGMIVTSSGKHIGSHIGLPFYTIGQRRGMEIGGGLPYYVAKKEPQTNTLLVAEGDNDPVLYSKEVLLEDVSWISGKEPKLPLQCEARIRYRQPLQKCIVRSLASNNLSVVFKEEQRAVTPGQSVVFYKGEEVLGGGVIA